MRLLLLTFTLLFGTYSDDVKNDGFTAEWRIFTQVCKYEEYASTWWGTDIVFYFKDGTNATFVLREGGPNYGMGRGELLQTKIDLPPVPEVRDVLLQVNPWVNTDTQDENLPCIQWLVMVEPSMDLCHAFYFYKHINSTRRGGSFPARKELDRPHADCIVDINWKKEELKEK